MEKQAIDKEAGSGYSDTGGVTGAYIGRESVKKDPILEEIHQIRERLLDKCGGDIEALTDRLKAREVEDRDRVISWKRLEEKATAARTDDQAVCRSRCLMMGGGLKKETEKAMKCAVCQNQMHEKLGEIDLRIEGKLYLVKNVSYEECPFCGEKVLTPDVARVLYNKVQKKDFVEQTLRIPVVDGPYA